MTVTAPSLGKQATLEAPSPTQSEKVAEPSKANPSSTSSGDTEGASTQVSATQAVDEPARHKLPAAQEPTPGEVPATTTGTDPSQVSSSGQTPLNDRIAELATPKAPKLPAAQEPSLGKVPATTTGTDPSQASSSGQKPLNDYSAALAAPKAPKRRRQKAALLTQEEVYDRARRRQEEMAKSEAETASSKGKDTKVDFLGSTSEIDEQPSQIPSASQQGKESEGLEPAGPQQSNVVEWTPVGVSKGLMSFADEDENLDGLLEELTAKYPEVEHTPLLPSEPKTPTLPWPRAVPAAHPRNTVQESDTQNHMEMSKPLGKIVTIQDWEDFGDKRRKAVKKDEGSGV
ncbi:MAG: hypothetical protein Q9180_008780 [Flavoplaca navasiana]